MLRQVREGLQAHLAVKHSSDTQIWQAIQHRHRRRRRLRQPSSHEQSAQQSTIERSSRTVRTLQLFHWACVEARTHELA